MGQYTDKMTQKYVKMSLFVRVVTHYGSNESNDSFGFFCVVFCCWFFVCLFVIVVDVFFCCLFCLFVSFFLD